MAAETSRPLALVALTVIVAGQCAMFQIRFRPSIGFDGSAGRLYRIAAIARERTNPSQSLIVIGDDWSSVVPYHARRKSLVLPPPWAPHAVIDGMIDDPQSLLGDRPLGAVVLCGDRLSIYGDRAADLSKFADRRAVLASVDGCALPSAHR